MGAQDASEPRVPDSGPGLEGVLLEGPFGRYLVGPRIAAGGMGTVHAARSLNLDTPVVVKFPHTAMLADPGFRERFQREISSLARLRHPHIVRILAQGEHGNLPFLVLEHMDGGSLGDRLAARPDARLSPAETIAWLGPVAEALDFVHASGVLHRDVKPGNILFDAAGHAFLSDFGLAKVSGDTQTSLTSAGAILGSPQHMAPEQALGAPSDGRADQYALASTVYEALAGTAPFGGESTVAVLVRKQREAPPHLAAHGVPVEAAAAAAVMRALARDPADRFPSCSAFARAFADAARGEGPPAAPPRRPGGRRRATLGIAAALVAGLVVWGATREVRSPGGSGTTALAAPLAPIPWTEPAPAQVEAARQSGLPVRFENELGMRFVLVPSGRFPMGSPPREEGRYGDQTLHEVTLTTPFYVQTTEVTNEQLRRFGAHDSGGAGGASMDGPRQPAARVTRSEALDFAAWLGTRDPAHRYRLPTEAEWEHAARAGTTGKFEWGEAEKELPRHANFADRRARAAFQTADAFEQADDGFAVTAPVGSFPPNPWGLHDMLGNVMEWCEDYHGPYAKGAAIDPKGPPSGTFRVLRGGSYLSGVRVARAAARFFGDPYVASAEVGFRLVAEPARR